MPLVGEYFNMFDCPVFRPIRLGEGPGVRASVSGSPCLPLWSRGPVVRGPVVSSVRVRSPVVSGPVFSSFFRCPVVLWSVVLWSFRAFRFFMMTLYQRGRTNRGGPRKNFQKLIHS